ncbi:MAG: glycerol-3-phosphate acyltransferase, partial [Burkholderiales bacterium]
PLWYLFLFGPDPVAAAVALMSALLVWRHANNIRNLLAGKESRIGQKKRA